jgi:hypothetical protein
VRLLLVISLLMAGCSTSPTDPLPKQPNAPTSPSIVETVGKEWDKADQKVAAAISIARENADKPAVVRGETTVALAYLPPASPEELALARQRAANPADQKAYGDAVEYGKKLLAKLDADFAKLEASQAEALRVSQLKDARIVELTAEVERVKKEAAANLWTLAAVGTAVAGALAMAFLGPKVGVSLLLSAGAIGAFPFIVESEYFGIIVGTTLGLAACIGLWVIWDKARDQVNKPDEQPPPQV